MDISLYFEEYGSGFPLILLHGNGGSGREFENQIGCFSKKYRVIAVDTRGHGQSPRGEKPFTLSQFAEDLHGFMLENGIEKAHILGFSDGGNIATLFALRYPEMVEKLILNGSNLDPFGMKTELFLQILHEYRTASDERSREMLGLMLFEPNVSPKELKGLLMPTLVLVGKNDAIRRGHTARIVKNIPICQLRVLEGDHFILQSNPEAYNAAVAEFLA